MEFELDKVEEYTTNQLQKFLDEIEEYWVKTNELYSMTDLLEINRELTLRVNDEALELMMNMDQIINNNVENIIS